MKVHGCTALITGASSGIGAATAIALADAGAKLMITGIDPTRLAQIAHRADATVIAADLLDPVGLDMVCQAAAQTDLVVVSAGKGWYGDFARMPVERIAELSQLNLLVPLQISRAALPAMRARGRGHLVLLSSVAVVGVGGEAVYSATKAGLRAFAASLRHELAGSGVGVTTVLPGAIDTPFFTTRGARYNRAIPRLLAPSTVASVIISAVEHKTPEVFTPRWLNAATRVGGAAPGLFHRLAGRFG